MQGFLFILRSIFYFYGSMFMCLYVSLFPSIQKTFIQKLHCHFASFCVSFIILLTCITFSLVVLLLCIPRLFMNSDFFILFLANWLGGTSSEAPSNKSVKSIITGANLPKPKLHASLLPWTKI